MEPVPLDTDDELLQHEIIEGTDFDSVRAVRSGASRWALRRGMTAAVSTVRLSAAERAGGAPARLRIRFEGEGLAVVHQTREWVQIALFPLSRVRLPQQRRPSP